MTIEDVERIGGAIGAWLKQDSARPTLLVGCDTRESSHRLMMSLSRGLTHAGISVVDVGILPTAALSYLVASKGFFSAAAMISASHNPIGENGIKLFDHRGVKVSDYVEQVIEDYFFGGEPLRFYLQPAPMITETSYAAQYARAMASEYRSYPWQSCRVIVDCANGAAYQVAPFVLANLRVSCNVLNADPDGTNINCKAGSEYARRNPADLALELRRFGGRVAIAFDGDADRVLFVDQQGCVYDGNVLLAILATKLRRMSQLKKNTVIETQMNNSGLEHYLHKCGIHVRTVHNGDKYVTDALLEEDLTLGGEEVGHVIIHTDTWHVTGDGLRTALWILSELTLDPNLTLLDLVPGMRKWPQINASVCLGRRTSAQVDDIPGLAKLVAKTQMRVPDLTKFECRPASTEPVYRIMLEARATPVSSLARHALELGQHIRSQLDCPDQPIEILDCVTGGYASVGFAASTN